jgi:hypothetical protein
MKNHFTAKTYAAFLAVVLCFSVLGIQSAGLLHGIHHANLDHHLHSYSVFDGIENGFSSDPQKSNIVCKLLDSLLLGTSVVSKQISSNFSDFSQIIFILTGAAGLTLLTLWPYQSQAPPQSNPQY